MPRANTGEAGLASPWLFMPALPRSEAPRPNSVAGPRLLAYKRRVLPTVLAVLALLSLALTLWQVAVARRFPLYRRLAPQPYAPAVTLLKPLKGCDAETARCLATWLTQSYRGPVQVLFGVASPDDPVCDVVRELIAKHPGADAQLVVCLESLGANAKVSTLIQLEQRARHDVLVLSDADVAVPSDFLEQIVAPLRENSVGLVNCFYRFANPANFATRWEAVAVNTDFWSQVLEAVSLKPMDFALGATIAVSRPVLIRSGGFRALADYLADDYQLGRQIARTGARLELCPIVVECHSAPHSFGDVWRHQVRWARTIRVCQPAPYFFSLLHNATLWPLLWLAVQPTQIVVGIVAGCWIVRCVTARWLQRRLAGNSAVAVDGWLPLLKDLFQAVIWFLAFVGNRIIWRGKTFRVASDGRLSVIDG